jgi:hypothetical protein
MDGAFTVGGGTSAPLALKRNESLQVQILYRPVNEGLDSGRLLVQSDDAETPVVTVGLRFR